MADSPITINLVQFGSGQELELEEGATLGDVASRVPNAENLNIRSRGQDARENPSAPVEDGQTVTAQPRGLKNGS